MTGNKDVFETASFRKGAVVDAIVKTDTEQNSYHNTVEKSKIIGRSIWDQLELYLDTVKSVSINSLHQSSDAAEAVFSVAQPSQIELAWRRPKELRSRFAPGLILDFPEIDLTSGEFRAGLRCCLTVCTGDVRSKIWTRFVSKSQNMADLLNGDAAASFYILANTLCSNVNDAIQSLYQEEFNKIEDREINLTRIGTINIFGLDSGYVELSNNIDMMYDDLIWGDGEETEVVNQTVAHAFHEAVTCTKIGFDGLSNDGPDRIDLTQETKLYPFKGRNGAQALFLAQTKEREGNFVGIISPLFAEKSAENGNRGNYYSASTGTTAEMAAMLGAQY